MMIKKLGPVVLILILSLSIFSPMMNAQDNESPISEELIWERNYDDGEGKERLEIYPDQNGNFFLIQGSDLDLIDSDGEKQFSKSFSNNVVGHPTVKDERLYIITQESMITVGERKTRLYCLDYRDGSKIWKKDIDYSCINILVTDNEKIYLPHSSGGNITKLSSEGEVIWRKEYPSASYISYGHILYDGIVEDKIVVLYLNSDSASKILCISSDGDVEWRNSIEDENIRTIQVDSETRTTYISTSNRIYGIDSAGEMETIHELDKGEVIDDFRFKNDRFYYIIRDHGMKSGDHDEDNTYHAYLISMNKKGEEFLNKSLGELEWGQGLIDSEFIAMSLPGNDRIYCQYENFTKDLRYNVYEIKAFDLDGNQKWNHIYKDGKVHSPHRISKEGVIVTKTKEGNVYAYQGYDPGSESRLILYLILGLVSLVLVLAGILFYYIKDL